VKYRLRDVRPEKAIVAPMTKPEENIEIGLAAKAVPLSGL
jgi:hypothetical protein